MLNLILVFLMVVIGVCTFVSLIQFLIDLHRWSDKVVKCVPVQSALMVTEQEVEEDAESESYTY